MSESGAEGLAQAIEADDSRHDVRAVRNDRLPGRAGPLSASPGPSASTRTKSAISRRPRRARIDADDLRPRFLDRREARTRAPPKYGGSKARAREPMPSTAEARSGSTIVRPMGRPLSLRGSRIRVVVVTMTR